MSNEFEKLNDNVVNINTQKYKLRKNNVIDFDKIKKTNITNAKIQQSGPKKAEEVNGTSCGLS